MLCVPYNKALFIAPILILSIMFNATAADRPAGGVGGWRGGLRALFLRNEFQIEARYGVLTEHSLMCLTEPEGSETRMHPASV